MIKNMLPGSIIYDLAAVQGGNTGLTQVDKIVEHYGIKIMGERNILNKLPVSSSNLSAKNLLILFLTFMIIKTKKLISI